MPYVEVQYICKCPNWEFHLFMTFFVILLVASRQLHFTKVNHSIKYSASKHSNVTKESLSLLSWTTK